MQVADVRMLADGKLRLIDESAPDYALNFRLCRTLINAGGGFATDHTWRVWGSLNAIELRHAVVLQHQLDPDRADRMYIWEGWKQPRDEWPDRASMAMTILFERQVVAYQHARDGQLKCVEPAEDIRQAKVAPWVIAKWAEENGLPCPVEFSKGASAAPTPKGYLREADLLAGIVPFSHATLWRRVNEGTFPKPIKMSRGITAWTRVDIDGWAADPKSWDMYATASKAANAVESVQRRCAAMTLSQEQFESIGNNGRCWQTLWRMVKDGCSPKPASWRPGSALSGVARTATAKTQTSSRRELRDARLGRVLNSLHTFSLELGTHVPIGRIALRIARRRPSHGKQDIVRQERSLFQLLQALQPFAAVVVDAQGLGLVQVEGLDDLDRLQAALLYEREAHVHVLVADNDGSEGPSQVQRTQQSTDTFFYLVLHKLLRGKRAIHVVIEFFFKLPCRVVSKNESCLAETHNRFSRMQQLLENGP